MKLTPIRILIREYLAEKWRGYEIEKIYTKSPKKTKRYVLSSHLSHMHHYHLFLVRQLNTYHSKLVLISRIITEISPLL